MGLDLQWLSSDRSVLDSVPDASDLLVRAIIASADRYPLLGIDPYATSDVSPSPQLTDSLRRLRDEQPDPEASLHLGRVLRVAAAAEHVRGSVLRFHGD